MAVDIIIEKLDEIIADFRRLYPIAAFNVLCSAPGALFTKTSSLAKAFYRTIKLSGKQPVFIVKDSASYEYAKKSWSCDMIAYGPGDSSLDHTEGECLSFDDFADSCEIIKNALRVWMEKF